MPKVKMYHEGESLVAGNVDVPSTLLAFPSHAGWCFGLRNSLPGHCPRLARCIALMPSGSHAFCSRGSRPTLRRASRVVLLLSSFPKLQSCVTLNLLSSCFGTNPGQHAINGTGRSHRGGPTILDCTEMFLDARGCLSEVLSVYPCARP